MKIEYLILMILFVQPLFGQTNITEMVTDRPNITESAVTVPLHFIQIETGYQYNKNGTSYTYHYGTTLLRYGLTSNIELRFAGEYQSLKRSSGVFTGFRVENTFLNSFENQIQGLAGTMVGAKFQLIKEEDNGFDLAVLTQLFLPWGKSGLIPEQIEPEIILSFDTKVTKGLSVGINSGLHWNSNSEKVNIFYSFSSEIVLSDVVSFYAEYSGVYENKTVESHLWHVIDSGFIFLLRKNIQFDFYSGANIFENTLNWFWGTGISFRFPG